MSEKFNSSFKQRKLNADQQRPLAINETKRPVGEWYVVWLCGWNLMKQTRLETVGQPYRTEEQARRVVEKHERSYAFVNDRALKFFYVHRDVWERSYKKL